jgi:dTDP-4-amino-4,6-dideoxygalactose transaminase
MKVPMLDTRRQNLPLENELLEAYRRVLHSGQFINGPEVERFESAAAEMAGARFAIGMSSGTDAILVALMALGIGAGDEVICPAFTFFATAGCIARAGARPVFADSCPECFNIDPESVRRMLTPRTKAIIPVHLFGQPADMDEILEMARRSGVAVIEDNAQSFGAVYRDRPAGSMGEFGTVSFFPSKNLGALGDAGLLVTNDSDLAKRARQLRNHGEQARYYHGMVGGNFRLDALQAAFLAVKLPHLGEYTAKRRRHAEIYTRAFAKARETSAIQLTVPAAHPDRSHIFNQYTVRVRAAAGWSDAQSPRDALRRSLEEKGIGTAVYYPVPLHRQECFQPFGPYPELPVAERLANEVLSLPVYPELSGEEQAAVIASIEERVSAAPVSAG